MGFERILAAVGGALISLGSSYGIWKLIEMILSGVSEGNWIMVLAGGILIYFFIGFLILGFILGLAIVGFALFD